VLGRWKRFARTLTASRCEALLLRLEPQAVQRPDALATEGWALASGGRAGLPRMQPPRVRAVANAAHRATPSDRSDRAVVRALPPAEPMAARARQRNLFTH
jgi:hypothetical protein